MEQQYSSSIRNRILEILGLVQPYTFHSCRFLGNITPSLTLKLTPDGGATKRGGKKETTTVDKSGVYEIYRK